MSSKTTALFDALMGDLSAYIDDYQFLSSRAGMSLWPDATVQQAQCHALIGSLFKKFNEDGQPSTAAKEAALAQFMHVNERCANWQRDDQVSWRMTELFNGLKTKLENFWHRDGLPVISSLDQIIDHGGTGPGSSRGAAGTDFYTKVFGGRLSYSKEDLLYSWERRVSKSDAWFCGLAAAYTKHLPKRVEGSSLNFVNKYTTIARTMGVEPTIEMWFQLGFGRLLAARLQEYYNIDLSKQQVIQRELACVGSADGSFGTIDLTSASDTIAHRLCREIMPKGLFSLCDLLRSKTTTLPEEFGGREVVLNMMSGMGNGFTFPMQTILFSAVVETVYDYMGERFLTGRGAGGRSFGVFGDDIIVTTRTAPLVLKFLEYLGFIPNRSKSYVEGHFRESCGADFYMGQPCRGVYIRRLQTKQDYYVAINNLNRWSAVTGIRLPKTIAHLAHAVKRMSGRVCLVPAYEPIDSGVRLPFDLVGGVEHLQHGLIRYHKDTPDPLRVTLAKAGGTITSATSLTSREVKEIEQLAPNVYVVHEDNEGWILRWVDAGAPDEIQEEPWCLAGKRGCQSANQDGLYVAFLRGDVRSAGPLADSSLRRYHITPRQADVKYRTKRATTAMWNTLGPDLLDANLTWTRWSDACYWNTQYV